MGKASEPTALLRYFISAKRRRKLTLLIIEWFKGLSTITQSSPRGSEYSEPVPMSDTWKSREKAAFDSAIYKRLAEFLGKYMVEEHAFNDGVLTVELEHSIQSLPNAYAYTNETTHFSVFNQQNHRLIPFSTFRAYGAFQPPTRRRINPTKVIPGVTANLYGPIDSAEGNYFHWFIDCLARLFLIERFYPLESIDQVLVPTLKYDFQWDALAAFGFDKSRVLELPALQCFQFDTLLVSSAPRGKGSPLCPGWGIDRYRDVLLNQAKQMPSVSGKKVYISRRDAPRRVYENEQEVSDFLAAQGFDIVELTPLTLAQKIAVFRDADIIISPTGAGLTNAMFCRKECKLLELVSEEFVYPSFALIAGYVGFEYHAHFFTNATALAKVNSYVGGSVLDIDSLSEALKKLV